MFGTPVDEMSNAHIKAELSTLYGISDFSDCLEVGDLRKKLHSTRDTRPISHGLQYGTLIELGNRTKPTGALILSHGLGDSAYGLEDIGARLARKFNHLLILLPTAPTREVTIFQGNSATAWYDILSDIGTSYAPHKQDAEGVLKSVDYLRSLAHVVTKKFNIRTQRVLYAGFSQGAAISLAAGLIGHFAAAGVACMSGYLPAAEELLPRIQHRDVPIAMFHGRLDQIVPLHAAKESKRLLEKEGALTTPIDFYEYDIPHSVDVEEIKDLERFIARVLP